MISISLPECRFCNFQAKQNPVQGHVGNADIFNIIEKNCGVQIAAREFKAIANRPNGVEK